VLNGEKARCFGVELVTEAAAHGGGGGAVCCSTPSVTSAFIVLAETRGRCGSVIGLSKKKTSC
jgi:hypothetical protein